MDLINTVNYWRGTQMTDQVHLFQNLWNMAGKEIAVQEDAKDISSGLNLVIENGVMKFAKSK